jgi:Transposase IS66 family
LVFKENKNIIFSKFVAHENYHDYCFCLAKLTELGYIVKSVSSDKHSSLISAVKTILPNIPHQYCLVHIQRRCQSLLTQNPETLASKDLLQIVKFINKVNTHTEKNVFISWLKLYEIRHKDFLNQRTHALKLNGNKTWWYTHKNVRKAFRHLKSSLNNMFFYLDNKNIPKDTNGLESEFTYLKSHLTRHRGLTRKRQESFVNIYWKLKSEKVQT